MDSKYNVFTSSSNSIYDSRFQRFKKKGKAPYGKVKPIGKKIISKPMIKGFKKRTISASKSFFNEPLGFPFARAKRIRPERKKKKR